MEFVEYYWRFRSTVSNGRYGEEDVDVNSAYPTFFFFKRRSYENLHNLIQEMTENNHKYIIMIEDLDNRGVPPSIVKTEPHFDVLLIRIFELLMALVPVN